LYKDKHAVILPARWRFLAKTLRNRKNSRRNLWLTRSASMKYLLALLFIFVTAAAAKADTVVNVRVEPTTFGLFSEHSGDETIGVTFAWDTTTNVLSNFVVTQSGPIPALTFSFVSFGSSFINQINFSDPQGDVFSVFREESGLANIGNTPGTYSPLGLDFICKQSGCTEGEFINFGTAVVTGTSTPAAEPGTLVLLGICFLGLLTHKIKPFRLPA
jgi:hypothetical protein